MVLFDTPTAAESAGFRPCQRCQGRTAVVLDPRALRAACRLLDSAEPPTLAQLAHQFGLTASTFQRQFKAAVGISPRDYATARRAGRLRRLLRDQVPVTSALYDAGYGSSSRLYEHANEELGMTPATYRRGGQGMDIHYVTVKCALGSLLVAATDRGVCSVKLGDTAKELEADLAREYPGATLTRDLGPLSPAVTELVEFVAGERKKFDLPLDVTGTAFQRQVWNQLRRIPFGKTASYGEIAASVGLPGGARAVAQACASNHAALLIPCHRVVQGNGGLGGYHWGVERKAHLVQMEQGQVPKLSRRSSR